MGRTMTLDRAVEYGNSGAVDIGDGFTISMTSHHTWELIFEGIKHPVLKECDSVAACILEADRIKREEGWYLEKQTWPLKWKAHEDSNMNDFYTTRSDVLGIETERDGTLHQVIVADEIRWTLGKWPGSYWLSADAAKSCIQRDHDYAMRAKLKGNQ